MKSNFFKYIFILFVVAIIIFTIYTIYFKNEKQQTEIKDETKEEITQVKDLRIGISNFDTINPLLTNNKEVMNIDKLIFEPLLEIDAEYRIKKCLATEYSKISDTSYIVKIDNNRKWQDGSPIIAKDIQFTIDRLKEGKSIYSYNVQEVISVEVLDANTVRINLNKPVSFFEYRLTFPILPNNYYIGEDFNTSTKIPMGTGMYKIDSIDNSNVILKKNERWWNIKNLDPKFENIQIKIHSEIGELYNSFKLGNIDIFTTANSNLEQYIGTIGYAKVDFKGREFDYLAFNCENEILKNKEVRRAISYAIDKNNIVSSVYNNEYYISDFPLDYNSYLYKTDTSNIKYSTDEAKKILTNNGWEYKRNSWQKKENYSTKKIDLKLTVNSNNEKRVKVAENIKQQLDQIGIKVTIKKVSDNQYQNILKNKNYDMIITGIYNSYSPDVTTFFEDGNLQNYNNEEIKNILSEIKNINDEELLKQKYQRIYEIFFEDEPFIGLCRNKIHIIKNQDLSGEITRK